MVEPSQSGSTRCLQCDWLFVSPDPRRVRRCPWCKAHEDPYQPRRGRDHSGETHTPPGSFD
jgi:hypothetical protein